MAGPLAPPAYLGVQTYNSGPGVFPDPGVSSDTPPGQQPQPRPGPRRSVTSLLPGGCLQLQGEGWPPPAARAGWALPHWGLQTNMALWQWQLPKPLLRPGTAPHSPPSVTGVLVVLSGVRGASVVLPGASCVLGTSSDVPWAGSRPVSVGTAVAEDGVGACCGRLASALITCLLSSGKLGRAVESQGVRRCPCLPAQCHLQAATLLLLGTSLASSSPARLRVVHSPFPPRQGGCFQEGLRCSGGRACPSQGIPQATWVAF